MGLDGISINQLRVTPELTPGELNSVAINTRDEAKIVDGLANGQKVDPDKEQEQNSQEEFAWSEKEQNEEAIQEEDIVKYDLSDSSKYILKLDQQTNEILIIEKASNNVIQKFSADELLRFVEHSTDSCGSIVNKKF